MKQSLIKSEDLEKAKTNEQFIIETAHQIIKDFGLFGIEISFSGKSITAYEELFRQLEEKLNILLINDYQKLLSLLYQIDLSEKILNAGNLPVVHDSEAAFITDLIIQRELIKVLTRHYFKNL